MQKAQEQVREGTSAAGDVVQVTAQHASSPRINPQHHKKRKREREKGREGKGWDLV
jgi:hypothetical protein